MEGQQDAVAEVTNKLEVFLAALGVADSDSLHRAIAIAGGAVGHPSG